jgi:hypothetical protein
MCRTQADQKNFSPAYDTQEQVYATILKLLDEAVTELGGNAGAKPGQDDLIYQGDLGKWTRLAYSLRARYLWHGSNAESPTSRAGRDYCAGKWDEK